MNAPDTQQRMDLRDYLAAVQRRRRPLTLVLVAGLILTVGLVLFLPAYYQSGGTILIEQQELPTELVRSTVTSYADQRVQTISQRVMTTQNLLNIIQKYDLYPAMRKRETREALIARMREDIKLNMISADVIDPRSGMPREATIAFSVSYTSRTPDQAVRVANELTTLYLNENLTERTRLAQDASAFLGSESDRISQQIRELEAKMATFKEKNGDALPELQTMNLTMMDRTEQDLRAQEARLVSLDSQRVFLEAQLAQNKPNSVMVGESGERIMTPTDRLKALRSQLASARALYADDHPDIIRMKREIAGLEAQADAGGASAVNDVMRRLDAARTKLGEVQKKYAPEHPDVIRAEREVASLQDELKAEQERPVTPPGPAQQPDNPVYVQLQSQLNATKNDQVGAQQQIEVLKKQLADYQRKLTVAPQIEKEYRELARDYQNAQVQYQTTRAKEMEAKTAQNLESDRKGERFTLIEPPLPPERPVSPNRTAISVVGVLLSLALAAGIVALLEAIDATVRGRKDMLRLLSDVPLALIPQIGTDKEARTGRMRLRYAMGGAAVAVFAAVIAIHLLYRPLDVLWFAALRKFGM